MTRIANGHPQWSGEVRLVEERLLDPLKWGRVRQYDADDGERYSDRSRRIFVNSMSDLFHENVPDEWIDKIFATMALCPQHTFQVLTKRPARMMKYLNDSDRAMQIGIAAGNMLDGEWIWGSGRQHRDAIEKIVATSLGLMPDGETQADRELLPLPNIWLGVSVENQATADERIPLLLETPAAVRFISAEPLLGPLELRVREVDPDPSLSGLGWNSDALYETDYWLSDDGVSSDGPSHRRIDWVICGGESGAGARPMHPDWARSLRDQCVDAGVPFFFKQWGEWKNGSETSAENRIVLNDGRSGMSLHSFDSETTNRWSLYRPCIMARVGKQAAGTMLDGRGWCEFPEART